jgi:hypothetical protein
VIAAAPTRTTKARGSALGRGGAPTGGGASCRGGAGSLVAGSPVVVAPTAQVRRAERAANAPKIETVSSRTRGQLPAPYRPPDGARRSRPAGAEPVAADVTPSARASSDSGGVDVGVDTALSSCGWTSWPCRRWRAGSTTREESARRTTPRASSAPDEIGRPPSSETAGTSGPAGSPARRGLGRPLPPALHLILRGRRRRIPARGR